MTAGPELGVSGFAHVRVRVIPAEGEDPQEEALISPVYLALGVSPLRLHFGRFVVSALEVNLGTAFFRSTSVRVQLGLLSIGGVL